MTEAFPWDNVPRYLLRDRDKSYGPAFRHRVRAMGVTEVITAPRSPWQNPSPHEEPRERSMRAHDPDGYTVEFAKGRRGHRGVT